MMPRYRKKPVVIDAFVLTRNFPDNPENDWFMQAITDGIIRTINMGAMPEYPDKPFYAEIKTLEGIMTAEAGDYIIRGVKGELYACKPDIFELTYEDADL